MADVIQLAGRTSYKAFHYISCES